MGRWILFVSFLTIFVSSCSRVGGLVSQVNGKDDPEADFGKVPKVPEAFRPSGARTKIEPTPSRQVQMGVDPASLGI